MKWTQAKTDPGIAGAETVDICVKCRRRMSEAQAISIAQCEDCSKTACTHYVSVDNGYGHCLNPGECG